MKITTLGIGETITFTGDTNMTLLAIKGNRIRIGYQELGDGGAPQDGSDDEAGASAVDADK